MKKKWWMIAAVLALALSLTSCSRRSGVFSNYGLNFCDGTMGQIDVYTVAVPGQAGTYMVKVIPVALTSPGDVATIVVANQATLAYKTLTQEVVLNNNQEITAGTLSAGELNTYDLISIYSYTPGVAFPNANPAKDAICGLPLLGDGVNTLNGQNAPQPY